MLRALGLKRAEAAIQDSNNNIDVVLKEFHDFELTLQAMDFVLDDQAVKGIQILNEAIQKQGREPIFILGLGVIEFIEATLGFEIETMKSAQVTLSEAENLSYKKKVHHEKFQIKTSSIYPPGTQYAVTYAESNLLIALVMLLSESVIESAKALYKLRKAYHTLDEINKSIKAHQQKSKFDISSSKNSVLNAPRNESASTLTSVSDISLTNTSSKTNLSSFVEGQEWDEKDKDLILAHIPLKLSKQQRSDIKVLKVAEKIYQLKKARIIGTHVSDTPALQNQRSKIGFKAQKEDDTDEDEEDNDEFEDAAEDGLEDVTEDISKLQLTDLQVETLNKMENFTIDEFIHSGVNLCFGILQVVLSLIPPAIGKVLHIVGFRGSRENGLDMLWKASNERNIHGDIATLGLLVFYDGPFQFTDTDFDIPMINENDNLQDSKSNDIQKIESRAFARTGEATLLHPGKKLEIALLRGRAFFPHSCLWLLQEGRMLASQGQLIEAVNLMDTAGCNKRIEMKQAEALLMFDKAMILVYLHRYERAAEHFLKLIELNSWSHALYTYMAACCYVECYRMTFLELRPVDKRQMFKDLAEKYLIQAPKYLERTNKSFFSNKQMPIDKYMLRKISGFKKMNTKYPKLDLVDCIGLSPIHELSYFWNSFNRMDEENLRLSLTLLGWNGALGTPHTLQTKDEIYSKIEENEQDSMLRYFFQSLTLRRLGKITEGLILLDTKVIKDKVLIYDTPVQLSETISDGQSLKFLNGSMISRYHKRSEDPWLYPTSLYERAIFCWKMEGLEGIEEVKDWLKKALNYADDYELSARTSMRIKAAMDRLEGY